MAELQFKPWTCKLQNLISKMQTVCSFSPKVSPKLLTWKKIRKNFTLCLSFLVFNSQTHNLKMFVSGKVNFLFLPHVTLFITTFLKTL